MNTESVCTIVITLTGDAERAAQHLQNIVENTPGRLYEAIIVVRQRTSEIEAFLSQVDGDVTIIWNENDPGIANARNQGMQAARHEAIVFTDQSTTVQSGWIEPMLFRLAHEEVAVTFPRIECTDNVRRSGPQSTVAALAIKRTVVGGAGGLTADPVELFRKINNLGWRIVPSASSVVTHDELSATWRSAGLADAAFSTEVHPLSEVKDRHKGEDIWVIASGASMDWIAPSFFANKVTIGLNAVYRKYPVNYLIRKEHTGSEEAVETGIPTFISRLDCGSLDENTKTSGKWWEYDHNINRGHERPPVETIGQPDKLIVSWSTYTSGLHLAAYMGAANIMICGHDCGLIDGKSNFDGYYTCPSPVEDPERWDFYLKLLEPFEAQTIVVRDKLTEVYGCSIHSLNPFVSPGLEGHDFRRATTLPVPAPA